MSLLGLPFVTLAAIFGVLGLGITLLYVLKLRRRRVVVPFSELWERVLSETQSDSLFGKLKRLLSLLLQLAFLFLLIAALGNPKLSTRIIGERRIILIIDTSASMKAHDASSEYSTRIDEAKAKAKTLVQNLSSSDAMMIVSMDTIITPQTPFTSDPKILLNAIEQIHATDSQANLSRALQFVSDALSNRKKPMLILIGDGAYDKHELELIRLNKARRIHATSKPTSQPLKETIEHLHTIDLSHVALHFIPVGDSPENIGIVSFNARRYPTNKLSFEIFLEIANYSNNATTVDLQLYADGMLNDVKRLSLAPNQRKRYTCSPSDRKENKKTWCDMASSGELLEARLVASDRTKNSIDAFPLDDRAFAILPRRHKTKVLLVSSGNLFLEGALLLDENIELEKLAPENYRDAILKNYDALVLDSFYPQKEPHIHTLIVNPPVDKAHKDLLPFRPSGTINRPFITEQNKTHPVMRFIELKDVNISQTLSFNAKADDIILASSLNEPIVIAKQKGQKRYVAFGFDLKRSDLPLRVAFPLMVINTLNWFASEKNERAATFQTGTLWKIPTNSFHIEKQPKHKTQTLTLKSPSGNISKIQLRQGIARYLGMESGVYTISINQAQPIKIAANLVNPFESNIRPLKKLIIDGQIITPPEGFSIRVKRHLWIYLLLLGLAIIVIEWLTYNRRLTV